MDQRVHAPGAMRWFGLFPIAVGACVLFFLWSQPEGGFGSPPMEVRVFGSIIGVFAVFFGVMWIGGFKAKAPAPEVDRSSRAPDPPGPVDYACPNCAAKLGSDVEVSPHGDAKCKYCGAWFNVHRR